MNEIEPQKSEMQSYWDGVRAGVEIAYALGKDRPAKEALKLIDILEKGTESIRKEEK